MTQAGYYRLEHSSVNRSGKGDGYLAASANYAANDNKCEKIIHINMAANRHAIRDYIERHEASLARRNARLGDKILVSIPVELNEQHREEAVRRFLWVITGKGQSRACAFYHTDKPHNPHFHAILLDRSVHDGGPVMLMGANRKNRLKAGLEPNPTVWLRKVWEQECNAVLAENGYEVRIDRRSNLEQGLDEPGEHRGWEAEQGEEMPLDGEGGAPLSPDAPMDPKPESEHASGEAEDTGDGDISMAKVELAGIGVDPVANIKFLHTQVGELEMLETAKRRVEKARNHYEALVAERQKVAGDAGDYYETSLPTLQANHVAQEKLAQYQTASGGLKGFGLRVFGYTVFETKTRREAEMARQTAHNLRLAANQVEYTRKAYDQRIIGLERQASQAEEAAYLHQAELTRLYGTDKELEEAEALLRNTVSETALVVSLEDAMTSYLEGEITVEEYRTFLREAGYKAELELLEEQLSQAEDGGQSL